MKKNTLYIEISARAKFSGPAESFCQKKNIDIHVYDFDLTHVVGDTVRIEVPMAFSAEASARAALFQELCEMFG